MLALYHRFPHMKSLISIFFVFYYIYVYRRISAFGGNDTSRYRHFGIGISWHPSSEFRTPILKILDPPLILLELVCCRQNVELEAVETEQNILAYWANDCYRCGRVDLAVEGDDEAIFDMNKALRFVAVALWCLQEDPTMRPSMLKVTQMLDGAVAIPMPPDASSFISSLP